MQAEAVKQSDERSHAAPAQSRKRGYREGLGIERVWTNGPLLMAASSLFWSGNFVVARAIQGAITPVELSFWRWLGALAILSGLAAPHLREDFGPLRRHWVRVLALAGLGIAAMNTLFYRGLQSTTAVNALLLQSAAPLLVLSCTAALYRERPQPRQVVAVLVSMLGVAAIAAHGDVAMVWRGFGFQAGDLWIVAGTLCYAGYTTVLRRRPAVHATSLLAASVAAGVLLLLLPFVTFQYLVAPPVKPSSQLVVAVAYLAVLPSVLAFLCLNRGVELLAADRAGQYVHLMPVFGSALALLFIGRAAASLPRCRGRFDRVWLADSARRGAGLVICGVDRLRLCSQRAEERRALRHFDA